MAAEGSRPVICPHGRQKAICGECYPSPAAAPAMMPRELPLEKVRERVALVGLVLVAIGFGFIYWPLGLIVPGSYLLAISLPRRR